MDHVGAFCQPSEKTGGIPTRLPTGVAFRLPAFRHVEESRWTTCQRFAELFGRQLTRVAGTDDVGGAEWGPNLCGRLSNSKRLGLSYAELSSGKALGFWFGLVWLLSLSFPEALGFWFGLVWFGC